MSFRDELSTGSLAPYAIQQLGDLPEALHTDRWKQARELWRRATELSLRDRLKLGWLLSRLGFHGEAVRVVSASKAADQSSPWYGDSCYLVNWCHFRLWLDDPTYSYSRDAFGHLAISLEPSVAKLNSSYQMVMQAAKFDSDVNAAEHWQELHQSNLKSLRGQVDESEWHRYLSRFHRVGGFIPQLRRDREGVQAEMSAAEEVARQLPRRDSDETMLSDEMLYPCLESRIKEAIWLEDLDLALERSCEYLSMRPADPKGWFHQGDVYVELQDFSAASDCYLQASLLAPPGKSIALFLRGQCQEQLDDHLGAFASYMESVELDDLAVSSIEAIQDLAPKLGRHAAADWASSRLTELLAVDGPEQHVSAN